MRVSALTPRRLLIAAGLLIVGLTACGREEARPGATATAAEDLALPPDSVRAEVEREIAALDAMRSRLAQTIGDGTADETTFANVCKPVGAHAKALAQTHGWQVQQMAERFRNPAHRLDDDGARAFRRFEEEPGRTDLWMRASVEGKTGWRYFRRITVERPCLACHGAKDARPDFVKEKYPDDRAYGFEVGDLRGIYSVFVPDPATDP